MQEEIAGDAKKMTQKDGAVEEIGIALKALLETDRPVHATALIDVLTGMLQAVEDAERRKSINRAVRIVKNLYARRGQDSVIRML